MADIVLTGGTGLLGSRVAPLLAREHRVWALARRPPGEWSGVRWIGHDLRQPDLPGNLPARVDAVIHLAQGREFRDFPGRAADTYAVNVAATALLLDFAVRSGARHFVLASTGGVYQAGSEPHREDEPIPLGGVPSFYVATKMASEVLAQAYRSELHACIVRPFFVYGGGQDPSMLIPRLVSQIRARQTISFDGPDGMRFNPIHVSDAARAVVASLDLEQSCLVNLAGPQVLSLRQAVEELAECLGSPVDTAPRSLAAPVDFVADLTNMTSLVGPPEVAFTEGARDVCG